MPESRKVLPLRPKQGGASAKDRLRSRQSSGKYANQRFDRSNRPAPRWRLPKGTVAERISQVSTSSLFAAVRLGIVWVIIILALLGLGLRLYHLQILDGQSLAAKAKKQQEVELRLFVPRRSIVDERGNVLAIDRPAYTLFAHPKLFNQDPKIVADLLAPLVQVPAAELLKKFQTQASGIRLGNLLREEDAKRVESFHTDGLELLPEYSRLYPQGDMAAEILGYVDLEHRGQAGLEFHQKKILEQVARPLLTRQTAQGNVLPDHIQVGALKFDDRRLMLTMDSRLQRAARTALKKALGNFGAVRGAVVVMDVQDGSIPALVVEPTYNANEYFKFPIERFKNWAVADTYEPGSTFKPLNVAIALEAETIKPTDIFNDPGRLYIGEDMIQNSDRSSRGDMNLTDILSYSSNIGMVKIIQTIPPKTYHNWLGKIGLGNKTGIDLPFEASGTLRAEKDFISKRIESATASFGQGFALTPLQLTQMIGSLANGGKLLTPHIIKGLVDEQGKLEWQATYPEPKQIFSPKNTQLVLKMMEEVVEGGTGKPARIPGYRIAGKTGTAQKATPGGGYTQGAIIASFVGIIPANAPRYVVLGVVDEPRKNAFGSTAAAPIVKEVMEALISIKQIPPS